MESPRTRKHTQVIPSVLNLQVQNMDSTIKRGQSERDLVEGLKSGIFSKRNSSQILVDPSASAHSEASGFGAHLQQMANASGFLSIAPEQKTALG